MQVTPLSSRQGQIRTRCQQQNPCHTSLLCIGHFMLCKTAARFCALQSYNALWTAWKNEPSLTFLSLLSPLPFFHIFPLVVFSEHICAAVSCSCISGSLFFWYFAILCIFAQLLVLLYTDISSSCSPRPSHRPHARGQNRGGPQRPGHSLLRAGSPQGPWSIISGGCSFFLHGRALYVYNAPLVIWTAPAFNYGLVTVTI